MTKSASVVNVLLLIAFSSFLLYRIVSIDIAHAIICSAYKDIGCDPSPPALKVIVPASPVVVEATGVGGAVATYTVTATGGEPPVTILCNPASGSPFPIGDTTVTCNATDSLGETATASFIVRVHDTTKPVITVPASPVVVDATSSAGATVSYGDKVSAADKVDGPITPTCNPASGSPFPIGDTTVTCNATDKAGNSAVPASFVVHVNSLPPPDEPPVITVPTSPMIVSATSQNGVAVTYTVAASDKEDGPITPTCNPASGSPFPIGDTTVTCNATDRQGLKATAYFTISVTERATVPHNLPPVAIIDIIEKNPAGKPVIFSANRSYDSDGKIQNYEWDFGDGGNDSGEITKHSYDEAGKFIVTLTVTDDGGLKDSTSRPIEIIVINPIGGSNNNNNTTSGGSNGSNNNNNTTSGGSNGSNNNNNTTSGGSNGSNNNNNTTSGGSNGSNNNNNTTSGGSNSPARKTQGHDNDVGDLVQRPVSVIVPSGLLETGSAVIFSGKNSYGAYSGDKITSYSWNFGDNKTSTGESVSHIYAKSGRYYVTLTVINEKGISGVETKDIDINAKPIRADFVVTAPSYSSIPIHFYANSSQVPDQNSTTTASYQWDFGDGTNSTGIAPTHTYLKPGKYLAKLTVLADNGVRSVKEYPIEVAAPPGPFDDYMKYGGIASSIGGSLAGIYKFFWKRRNGK